MILRSVEPVNFGPFATRTTLLVEPEVTVLTGANDTGKSTLLRLIRVICTGGVADERDYNRFRMGAFAGSWQEDPDFGCAVTFELSESSKDYLSGPQYQPGDRLSFFVCLSPQRRQLLMVELRRGDKKMALLPTEWVKNRV